MVRSLQPRVLRNLMWFAASLSMAVLVWFVATIEADPIDQRRFTRIAVQVLADENMIITERSSEVVSVTVRAQQSVLELLTNDDIVVRADLRGHEPGVHTVPLSVEIARPASVADTQPRQITLMTERRVTQLKPVQIHIVDPPVNFRVEELTRDMQQAEVSGAEDLVETVTEVVATLDLSEQRSEASVERTLQLSAVDANGNVVEDVSIAPRSVVVNADVVQREDVRMVSVRPRILLETLPDNYEFLSLDYTPSTVLINGSPEELAQLGSTVDTEPISLEGRTDDFVAEVPLDLPSDTLLVVSETGIITVDVSINEQTTSLPIENVPVSVLGLPDDADLQLNPEVVSVVLSGPVSILEQIAAEDVQAVIDVNTLEPGTSEVVPQIIIQQGQISLAEVSVTLLPAQVTLTLTSPTPEATPALTPEGTPDPTPDG